MYFSPILHNLGNLFNMVLLIVHLKHIFEVNQILLQHFTYNNSVQKLLRKLQVDEET